MRLEARAKAKEIHDTHIGCLKIFAGMNKMVIDLDSNHSDFSYKKFIGSTYYQSKNGMSLDNPIAVTNVKFVSDIQEDNIFESLNIIVKLDPSRPQTDEIALNHLLWMNGLESVFRDLLDESTPTRKIQAVADILVFYHEFLSKNRQMEGNSYKIETSNPKVSLVVTYIGSHLFDVHLTRTIDYEELKDFLNEEEEEQATGFFAKFKKPRLYFNKPQESTPVIGTEVNAPVEEERITEVVTAPEVIKGLKAKSLFSKKKHDFEDLEEAIKGSDISIETDEEIDPITKALQLKMEREKLNNTGSIPVAKEEPIVVPVAPAPMESTQKEHIEHAGTSLSIEDIKTHIRETKKHKEESVVVERNSVDDEIASIVENTIKEEPVKRDDSKFSLESISKSIDEQVKAARAYRAQVEQQTAQANMTQPNQQAITTNTIDLTGVCAEMDDIDDIVDDSALEDCFI